MLRFAMRYAAPATVLAIALSTSWARGQAWAVYGFTMVYRETGDPMFLDAARRTADYFVTHLPDDFVPMADFQSTYTDLAHKDSSAAAIAASGLVELSQLETDPTRGQSYRAAAANILDSLASPSYFSSTAANAGLRRAATPGAHLVIRSEPQLYLRMRMRVVLRKVAAALQRLLRTIRKNMR